MEAIASRLEAIATNVARSLCFASFSFDPSQVLEHSRSGGQERDGGSNHGPLRGVWRRITSSFLLLLVMPLLLVASRVS